MGPFERPVGLPDTTQYSGLQWALVEFEVPVLAPAERSFHVELVFYLQPA
jgi:hypothetical protein